MAWKVRHQGSPTALGELELPQVLEGLVDGRWEPTDEVMGPHDADWVPIENHPQLADVAAELEPPPPRHYDDETRLDMNALIDVCLVLLIFFILTTSYAVIQKRLEAPGVTGDRDLGPAIVTTKQISQQMIRVSVKMENGQPVFRVEDQAINPEELESSFRSFVNATAKTRLLVQLDYEVPQRAMVQVLDAARGARMEKVLWAQTGKSKR